MKNILKNAKFRDEFLTKGGDIVVFWQKVDQGITCFGEHTIIGYKDGNPEMPMTHNDNDIIVSHYQEPIDEEKLDILSLSFAFSTGFATTKKVKEAYKAGYKKAKEE